MDQVNLQDEWHWLMQLSGIGADEEKRFFSKIISAYSESHRHYHTDKHLSQVLSELRAAKVNKPAAYWATWYHDIVYIPGHSDNEQKSADAAKADMKALAIDEALIEHVAAIIMATKTHTVGEFQDRLI